MYKLTVSADLKAWLNQVIRINKTFTADYKGLAAGKKAFVVTASSGGGYGAREPMEKINFQDPYLRTAFGFIGIADVEFINVNNTAKGDEAARIGRRRAQSLKQLGKNKLYESNQNYQTSKPAIAAQTRRNESEKSQCAGYQTSSSESCRELD